MHRIPLKGHKGAGEASFLTLYCIRCMGHIYLLSNMSEKMFKKENLCTKCPCLHC